MGEVDNKIGSRKSWLNLTILEIKPPMDRNNFLTRLEDVLKVGRTVKKLSRDRL